MEPLTLDEVYGKLGLDSFVKPSPSLRGSGSTTKMILESLVSFSEGNTVIVVGHDHGFSRYLLDKIKHYAEILELPLTDHLIVTSINSNLRGLHGVYFIDHHTRYGNINDKVVEELDKYAERVS